MDDDFNSDDFDKILAKIQEESLRHYNEVELPRAAALKEQEQKKNLDISEADIFKSKVTSKDINTSFCDSSESLFHHGEDAEGFHYAAGKTYIYPSNYPVRKYQADIVPTALFHNTLVSLPTGLGKTFIAAVVMYNFYRWYPMGKVIFMAPTRPLVTQQLSACRDIMGIPVEDTVELTGTTMSGDRKLLWNTKRVFYLTPQVLMNDLKNNLLQASSIKCLVIDEAHRATKGYAYCQVVKILFEENVKFRILALSATPGTDANAVKDVILNLHIEKLEIRSEDSADVVEYSHTKSVIPIIVDLPAFLRDIWNQYMEVYENYVRKIRELKVLNQNVATMSKFQMLTAFRKFTSRPPSTLPNNVVQTINGDFTSCITLAHGRELLQTYGLRTFHSYFTDAENSSDKAASITRLSHDRSFRKLLGNIEKIIFKEDNGDSRQYNWSHPKMEHLVDVVREHFEMKAKASENTKAIIFCQYRLVVTEVYEIMKKFVPHAKPVMFIGQSSKEKGQGLPQKKQIEVMKLFRSGEYNVMIATSVAEEGLDIGDVDLIVSMETHRSPIKLVQRFGRTGRKRSGRCVVLLTSGAEVKKFNEVMSTQKNYTSIISAPGVRASLEENSPRMVPQNCNPKLQLLHIKVPKLDKRKQCDIRNVFGRLDTSRTHVPSAALSVPTSAFLTDAELAEVRNELGSYFPNFHRLPPTCDLWPRQKGPRLEIDEFASDKFSGYSDWLDWSKDFQQTHVVGHSRDSKILVELLQKSAEIRERTDRSDEPVHDLIPSPPSSLWSTVGANQNQKKKRKNEGVKKTKSNGKNQPKSKHGLDIRECMAKVPPKLGFISQDSTMDDVYSVFNRKNTTNYKNIVDLTGIEDDNEVIIINDDLDQILDDILIDFPNILGKPQYCSLSRNSKDIRSVALKCFNTSVKCEVNFDILPNICGLLEGIAIDDVKNLDLNELPCIKSTTSSLKNEAVVENMILESVDIVDKLGSSSLNKQVDFVNINRDSVEIVDRFGSSSLNEQVHFVNINRESVEIVDRFGSSSLNKQVDFVNINRESVEIVDRFGSSSLNKHVDFVNIKKQVDCQNVENKSSIDLDDEDTCLSTDSFIVGLDEIMKSFNAGDETNDLDTPLKDATHSNTHKNTIGLFNAVETKDENTLLKDATNSNTHKNEIGCGEDDWSPILSQRPPKTKKVKTEKSINFSNMDWRKAEGEEGGFEVDENELSPILSQRPHKKKSKGLKGNTFNNVTEEISCLHSVTKENSDKVEELEHSRPEEMNLSPILSQRPQNSKSKGLKGNVFNNFTKGNSCNDEEFEHNRLEEMNLSPILSQRQQNKISKDVNSKISSKVTKGNYCKNEGLECIRLEEMNLSPDLSQRPKKLLKGSEETLKRKLDVEIIAPQPKFPKKVDKNAEKYLEDNQALDTAFMDEFDEDMLAQLSPILSCKSQTFKNPENTVNRESKHGVTELKLSPILSQPRQKSSKNSGVNVGECGRLPNVTSSTPKCVKKDLFQDLSKFDRLSSVKDVCKTGNEFEEILKENKEDDENVEDFEGIVSLDEILALSKCDEENSSTVIDPTPTHSPKRLSYYMKGNSLYTVTQLVEKAMQLEAERNKQNGSYMEEENEKSVNKIDEFILNSSDDDLFHCADSKIDLNFEVGKSEGSVKHENISVNKSNQSLNDSKKSIIEISDGSKSATSKKNTGNENNLEKSQEVLDDDEDYFEITGLDELMHNCIDNKSSNLENFKSHKIDSKASTSVQPTRTSELKIVSEEDELLIESCLDDIFINSLEKIESQLTDMIPPKQAKNSNTFESESEISKSNNTRRLTKSKSIKERSTIKSKSETFSSTSKIVINKAASKSKSETEKSTRKEVADPLKPKCSTQFKSDYLSNEELEELLKSGMFSDSPIMDVPDSKTEKPVVDFLDLTENDSEIIDNSNELYLESPLLLSYGNRSDKIGRSLCSNKDNNCPQNSKFSLLSKSKSKGGLNLEKNKQSKLSFASTSKQKESGGSSGMTGSDKDDIKTKSDESFSWRTPVVLLTKLENIKTKGNTSDETFSWGSPATKETKAENTKTKFDRSEETSTWEVPDLKETETKLKNSDRSDSGGSLVVKGTKRENIDSNLKNSGGILCLGSPSNVRESRQETIKTKLKKQVGRICLEDKEDKKTKHRNSEDSFSWEMRGCRQLEVDNESNKSDAQKESNDESVIDDDSFAPGRSHRRRGKPVTENSSTDVEEGSFLSIHTSVQKEADKRVKRIRPSLSFESRKSTSFKASKSSDTDDSSDIFILSPNKKSYRSLNDSGASLSKHKGGKSKKSKKKKKPNAFIESEADVSGDETSSGRETSGLDSLDESFVDDKVNDDNTMMVAHYLQAVKTPKKIAGGYRIPELSESVMAREVYSQYVPMEHETYVNDSFCVEDDSGSNESEMSELEIAEKLLAKRKKHKKRIKRKRKSSFESATDFQVASRRSEENRGKKKNRRIVILDDSSE